MMMELFSRVVVESSPALGELKIQDLAGQTGTVVDDLTNLRRNKGYMVRLDKPYMGEKFWFVPLESVKEYEQD